MAVKLFTARDLNQRTSVVTQAVDEGNEVLITKHGRVVYRLSAIESALERATLLEVVRALPDSSEVDVDFDRVAGTMREVDL